MTALPLCIYNYSFVEESEGTPLSPNSIFVQLSTNDLNGLKACWYKCIDNCRVKSNHGGNPAAPIDISNVIMPSTLIENSVIPRQLNFIQWTST